MQNSAKLLKDRFSKATIGRYGLGHGLGDVHYTGESVGIVTVIPDSMTVDEVTKAADREMYKVEHQRAVDDFRKAEGQLRVDSVEKLFSQTARTLMGKNTSFARCYVKSEFGSLY